jgi:hypothetical protein
MPGNPAIRDSLAPLTLEQMASVYKETITSHDVRVLHTALQLIWHRLEQVMEEAQ